MQAPSYMFEHALDLWASESSPTHLLRKEESVRLQEDVNMCVHSTFTCGGRKLETTQMGINKKQDKQIVVCSVEYDWALFFKEYTIDTYDTVVKSQRLYVKQKEAIHKTVWLLSCKVQKWAKWV